MLDGLPGYVHKEGSETDVRIDHVVERPCDKEERKLQLVWTVDMLPFTDNDYNSADYVTDVSGGGTAKETDDTYCKRDHAFREELSDLPTDEELRDPYHSL